jgi:hybrid cluster-associated redox disulfide protein
MSIADDDLVDEVMRREPHTIRVFLAFRMGCVGCPLAGLHTLADACREHHIVRDVFLAKLHHCAEHPEEWDSAFRKHHAQEES